MTTPIFTLVASPDWYASPETESVLFREDVHGLEPGTSITVEAWSDGPNAGVRVDGDADLPPTGAAELVAVLCHAAVIAREYIEKRGAS